MTIITTNGKPTSATPIDILDRLNALAQVCEGAPATQSVLTAAVNEIAFLRREVVRQLQRIVLEEKRRLELSQNVEELGADIARLNTQLKEAWDQVKLLNEGNEVG